MLIAKLLILAAIQSALAGQMVVIWPSGTHNGTVSIRAFVPPKTQMTLNGLVIDRQIIQTSITPSGLKKIVTITPF